MVNVKECSDCVIKFVVLTMLDITILYKKYNKLRLEVK
jgi:hypothetical protein